jgi:cytochrome c oxidase cbb3-type subunit 3
VLDKGMLSYKSQLSGKQIDLVIEYILSLQGTNPPNAKAPQGEKFVKK